MLVTPSDIARNTQEQGFELGRNYNAHNPTQYSLVDTAHQNFAAFNVGESRERSGWLGSRLEGGYLPELETGESITEQLLARAAFFHSTISTAIAILETSIRNRVDLHFLHLARAVNLESGEWSQHAVVISTNPKAFYHTSSNSSTSRHARELPVRKTTNGISAGIVPVKDGDLLVFSSLSESLRKKRCDLANIQGDNSAQDIADTMAKLTDPPAQPSDGHVTLGIRIL